MGREVPGSEGGCVCLCVLAGGGGGGGGGIRVVWLQVSGVDGWGLGVAEERGAIPLDSMPFRILTWNLSPVEGCGVRYHKP